MVPNQRDEKLEFHQGASTPGYLDCKALQTVPRICPLFVFSEPPADLLSFKRKPEWLRSAFFRVCNHVNISSSLKTVCRRKIKPSAGGPFVRAAT